MFRFRFCTNWLLICLLAASTVGCTWPLGYIGSAIDGEVRLLSTMVPIEEALDDPTLSDQQRQQLSLVIQARDYAEQVIGLNVGGSFRNFVNLHGQPLAYNLSASPKDAIEPFVWDLPVVGPYPYLGFFDYEQALATRDWLLNYRYDTFMYSIDAYSTLGILPDPLTSGLLDQDQVLLVDTVFHELLHNTIYHPEDTIFNESLAVFVAKAATPGFIEYKFGPDSPLIDYTRQSYEDSERFNEFLPELVAELNSVYQSDLSYDEKLAARKEIFDSVSSRSDTEVLPFMNDPTAYQGYKEVTFNNAFLLVQVRYHSDLHVYEQIYEATSRNWEEALAIYAQAANETRPVEYLENLLTDWK